MPVRSRGRSGRPWERAKAACKRNHPWICIACDLPIPALPPRQCKSHPLAWSAHHLLALHHGGAELDPANIRPAHRWCNGSVGTKPITAEVRERCRANIAPLLAALNTPTVQRRTW